MKIKLLLLLFITASIAFAQHQVNSFYSTNGFVTTNVTTANAPVHGAGGTNQTWTFSGFISLGKTQRNKFCIEPALSFVPDALAPPNGCIPTTAPVGLSLI